MHLLPGLDCSYVERRLLGNVPQNKKKLNISDYKSLLRLILESENVAYKCWLSSGWEEYNN